MSIRPIDFNGMLQRTGDMGTIKHQEDSKPLVDQQNIQVQLTKNEDAMRHQVTEANSSESMENEADAREEGKGQYFDSRRQQNKKEKKKDVNRVIKKEAGNSFDIKI